MKTIISEIKYIDTLDGVNVRLDNPEEISDLEDKVIEIIPNETQRGKMKERGKLNSVNELDRKSVV